MNFSDTSQEVASPSKSPTPTALNEAADKYIPPIEVLHLDHNKRPAPSDCVVLAIRKDAGAATRKVREELQKQPHIAQDFVITSGDMGNREPIIEQINKTMRPIYMEWGNSILEAMAECLDYNHYEARERRIQVHFYNANRLAETAIKKAENEADISAQKCGVPRIPHLFVSLDDMIDSEVFRKSNKQDDFGEIGFSRLFDINGEERNYVARPGKPPLKDQIQTIYNHLQCMQKGSGNDTRVPIILIEDNVRKAKTINWIINELGNNNIFDHGRIVCIATCFCVAPTEERNNIKFEGKVIPLAVGADYCGARNVDVTTTRDLLHDGSVIEIDEKHSRIPLTFMETQQVIRSLKIAPDKAEAFLNKANAANIRFCESLEHETGIKIPLAWFTGGDAISHLLGIKPDEPMIKVLQKQCPNPSYVPKP